MADINIPNPEDLKKVIDRHNDVEGIKIAQQALWDHAHKIDLIDKLLKNSKLAKKDTIDFYNKINIAIAKIHGL